MKYLYPYFGQAGPRKTVELREYTPFPLTREREIYSEDDEQIDMRLARISRRWREKWEALGYRLHPTPAKEL